MENQRSTRNEEQIKNPAAKTEITRDMADVSRMYIPRKEGGRGMINLEMTYKTMTSYLESSEDRMLHAVYSTKRRRNFTQW